MQIDLLATVIALLTSFGIATLMALSLNLEYGVAGIPNFGKAAFVSFGAYAAGLSYSRVLPALAGQAVIDPCGTTIAQALHVRTTIMQEFPLLGGLNFAGTLLAAAIFGGIVGYLVSYLSLRLKHKWLLAIVLLVGSETVRIVVRGYPPITCASNGLSGIAQPFAWVGGPQASAVLFALLALALAAAAFVYSEQLVRSPFGRLLRAVRENDQAALSLGKPVARVRSQVMFIGSAMAAVAGVLFAVNIGFVSTNDYVLTLTLDVWVMVVLGGSGSNRGAVLGALIITLLDRLTAIAAIQLNMSGIDLEFNYVRYILFGIALLVMLRHRPAGLIPERTTTTQPQPPLAFPSGALSQD
jgi:branched-chain amino acid transport system permease protein